MGKHWKQWQTLFFLAPKSLQVVTAAMKWKDACFLKESYDQPWNEKMLASWKKAMTNLDSILKSRDITLPTKVCVVKAMVFPVVMYVTLGLWRKLSAEELMPWTVMLEKTLESPLDCKESQPVHPKRNQSLIFIGRTDAEAETLILWPSDVKN